jgi:hypothetical protein
MGQGGLVGGRVGDGSPYLTYSTDATYAATEMQS